MFGEPSRLDLLSFNFTVKGLVSIHFQQSFIYLQLRIIHRIQHTVQSQANHNRQVRVKLSTQILYLLAHLHHKLVLQWRGSRSYKDAFTLICCCELDVFWVQICFYQDAGIDMLESFFGALAKSLPNHWYNEIQYISMLVPFSH